MLYKDMTDSQLVEAYWAQRETMATWDGMTRLPRPGRRKRSRIAGGVLRASRNIDIIVAIARKRGVSLRREA